MKHHTRLLRSWVPWSNTSPFAWEEGAAMPLEVAWRIAILAFVLVCFMEVIQTLS